MTNLDGKPRELGFKYRGGCDEIQRLHIADDFR